VRAALRDKKIAEAKATRPFVLVRRRVRHTHAQSPWTVARSTMNADGKQRAAPKGD
jgi:hypothetical protein